MWIVQYTGTADAYSFLDVNRTAADAPAFAKGLTSAIIEGMDRLYAAGETSGSIPFEIPITQHGTPICPITYPLLGFLGPISVTCMCQKVASNS
jgi:hypothetical protein